MWCQSLNAGQSDQVYMWSMFGCARQKIFVWQQATGYFGSTVWLWQQLGIVRGCGWCIATQSGCLSKYHTQLEASESDVPPESSACCCYLDESKHMHEGADYTLRNKASYCCVLSTLAYCAACTAQCWVALRLWQECNTSCHSSLFAPDLIRSS